MTPCKHIGHRPKVQRGVKRVQWVCLDCSRAANEKYENSGHGKLTRLLYRVERRDEKRMLTGY
jgi:hypothetical protein